MRLVPATYGARSRLYGHQQLTAKARGRAPSDRATGRTPRSEPRPRARPRHTTLRFLPIRSGLREHVWVLVQFGADSVVSPRLQSRRSHVMRHQQRMSAGMKFLGAVREMSGSTATISLPEGHYGILHLADMELPDTTAPQVGLACPRILQCRAGSVLPPGSPRLHVLYQPIRPHFPAV